MHGHTNVKSYKYLTFTNDISLADTCTYHLPAFLCAISYICPLESLEYQNIVEVLVLYVALTLAVATFGT